MFPKTALVCLLAVIGCNQPTDPAEEKTQPQSNSTVELSYDHVFAIPVDKEGSDWRDYAYLAAIPTASHVNGGAPLVLALDGTPDEATLDLMQRLNPPHLHVLNNAESGGLSSDNRHETSADDVCDFSLQLLNDHWSSASRMLVSADDQPNSALFAAGLAAKLGAPLVICSSDRLNEAFDAGRDLAVSETIVIDFAATLSLPDEMTVLTSVDASLEWLSDPDLNYIALANVADWNSGRAQKQSLTAAQYAAFRGGLVLPVEMPMPLSVMSSDGPLPIPERLATHFEAMGHMPSHLALVGAYDALPHQRHSNIFDTPIEQYPVSDAVYGQVDTDPFLDIAIGRLVSENIENGSVLATRIIAYDALVDGSWDRQFIESGLWGFDELRQNLINYGYDAPAHLSKADIDALDRIDAAAILHKDHSNCVVLGHAFDLDTQALLSPAVVTSRGCSVAGMDQVNTAQRTIVDHMLGRGAVAFLGASRNAIAENTLMEVTFWNRLLEGDDLGTAFRRGYNEMTVHWLDENNNAGVRYSLDIEMLYGDPAMRVTIPEEALTAPASLVQSDSEITLTGPEEWTLVPFKPDQLAEWNYTGDLNMYTAPGITARTYWSGQHDNADLYYGVDLPVAEGVTSVEQLDTLNAPLGLAGQAYIDTHPNGGQNMLFRVRMLDYDMYTGEVSGGVDTLRFQLVSE